MNEWSSQSRSGSQASTTSAWNCIRIQATCPQFHAHWMSTDLSTSLPTSTESPPADRTRRSFMHPALASLLDESGLEPFTNTEHPLFTAGQTGNVCYLV